MHNEIPTFWSLALLGIGAAAYIIGGVRFRRWAVEDRAGIPRYPVHVETVLLWLIYSVVISIAIVVIRQTLRHL